MAGGSGRSAMKMRLALAFVGIGCGLFVIIYWNPRNVGKSDALSEDESFKYQEGIFRWVATEIDEVASIMPEKRLDYVINTLNSQYDFTNTYLTFSHKYRFVLNQDSKMWSVRPSNEIAMSEVLFRTNQRYPNGMKIGVTFSGQKAIIPAGQLE